MSLIETGQVNSPMRRTNSGLSSDVVSRDSEAIVNRQWSEKLKVGNLLYALNLIIR